MPVDGFLVYLSLQTFAQLYFLGAIFHIFGLKIADFSRQVFMQFNFTMGYQTRFAAAQ